MFRLAKGLRDLDTVSAAGSNECGRLWRPGWPRRRQGRRGSVSPGSVRELASRLLRNFVIGITCTIAGAFVVTGVIVWAPLPQASRAQAQSDLAALQHDDNFAGDLRALSSDAHLTGPDLAATKGDAALGTGCYNVSTVKIDATILKQDASTVSIDLSTLTTDIG